HGQVEASAGGQRRQHAGDQGGGGDGGGGLDRGGGAAHGGKAVQHQQGEGRKRQRHADAAQPDGQHEPGHRRRHQAVAQQAQGGAGEDQAVAQPHRLRRAE